MPRHRPRLETKNAGSIRRAGLMGSCRNTVSRRLIESAVAGVYCLSALAEVVEVPWAGLLNRTGALSSDLARQHDFSSSIVVMCV